jgi:hypothetical protein
MGPLGPEQQSSNAAESQERGFDLGEIDSVAPEFHLKIFAPAMLKATIRPQVTQVPSAVDPLFSSLRIR